MPIDDSDALRRPYTQEEFRSAERMFLCEYCLKYMRKKQTLTQHKARFRV